MPNFNAEDTNDPRQLSRNFWLDEFDCRDGTPVPAELIDDLAAFASNLQVLRTFVATPIYILSGYRTKEYNKSVGGAKRSYHVYDDRPGKFAADLAVVGVQPTQVKMILEGLIRVGLIPEGGIGLYKNFVHYDNRGFRARWSG